MVTINLNRVYNYRISSPCQLRKIDRQTLSANPPAVAKDWSNTCYEDIKQRVKKNHLQKQNGRCAYCRNWVEVDGKYEPIEHVIAKSTRPDWMFKTKNLIITCDTCNNLKGKQTTLNPAYKHWKNFPNNSDAFIIFNPHFDTWNHHFKIENDIFLVAKKKSKGDDTIRICKLHRYHVPVNNARNRLMSNTTTSKAITTRLYITNTTSPEYQQLQDALNYYLDQI
jgi:uncharacterized protein (TIGR02646 family)